MRFSTPITGKTSTTFQSRLGTVSPNGRCSASQLLQGGWCLFGGNPNTREWTLEEKRAIKLKKESYERWLACGSSEAADEWKVAQAEALAKPHGMIYVRPWKSLPQ